MKRLLRILFFVCTLGILQACYLFKPSAHKMTRLALKAHSAYDAIIVPGVAFYEPCWNQVMQMRLLWAKHLYDRGLAKHIITSGSSVYSPFVEARIMAEYLVAMGVPREKIFTEELAEHSTENVWYGYKVAKRQGFKTVAVCSDPFQSKMLYSFTKKRLKKQVFFLPAIFDTLRTLPHDTPAINYKPHLIPDFVPITEKQSFWRRWKGTLGKNINYDE